MQRLTTVLLALSLVALPLPASAKEGNEIHAQQERATDFSVSEASAVLNQIHDGLQGQSRSLLFSAFDGAKMEGYREFRDQIESLFNQSESLRVYYRIVQVASEGGRGIVLADMELERVPRGASAPVRKRAQLRFELERGPKGWKVVDLRPRGFFSS